MLEKIDGQMDFFSAHDGELWWLPKLKVFRYDRLSWSGVCRIDVTINEVVHEARRLNLSVSEALFGLLGRILMIPPGSGDMAGGNDGNDDE